ncbi:V-type ATP synthase subunit D [Candidatus Bathyarchaeota archaeon]|jgi:V/A-type H+-transporting ATPase subunit D|nr:V-type ATP synthase subunit D [Candidatus Bathyarchaeota archaeon]
MSEVIPGIHPTRMELLALRKRRDIAERGRDLLREKLDALMIEFFESVRNISALRERSHALLEEAYALFIETQMIHGSAKLEQLSIGVEDRFDLEAETRNVIGVTLPDMQLKVSPLKSAPYNLLATSARLDDATMKMAETLKAIAELSSAEAATRKLAEAIASTKRRVNSLDYIIIPRVLGSIRYIQMHLEEREREDFFRLKRIKSRMEKQARAA